MTTLNIAIVERESGGEAVPLGYSEFVETMVNESIRY